MVFNFEQKPGQMLEKKCIQEQITPRVSIVTPYYNSGRNFEETYRCVINQTMREFEWIIMDDGSSRKEDIELLERLGESDTRIHVFHQKNGGQSKAKNEAVKKTMTDIIVFLDADDLVEPFYIEYLYKALQEEPNAGWSYMDLVGFGSEQYVWCKKFSAGRMTFNNILVNAAAFRKEQFLAVGGFSEIAKHYDEDWALYLKLMSKGVYPVHIPMIGFWYRRSATGMQKTVRNNVSMREKSDRYIAELAKHVDISLSEKIYKGTLPDCAIKSEYSRSDNMIAKMCTNRGGLKLVKWVYGKRG